MRFILCVWTTPVKMRPRIEMFPVTTVVKTHPEP